MGAAQAMPGTCTGDAVRAGVGCSEAGRIAQPAHAQAQTQVHVQAQAQTQAQAGAGAGEGAGAIEFAGARVCSPMQVQVMVGKNFRVFCSA